MISYSKMSTYQRCPAKYHIRYEAGLRYKGREASPLSLGSLVHALVAAYYKAGGLGVEDVYAQALKDVDEDDYLLGIGKVEAWNEVELGMNLFELWRTEGFPVEDRIVSVEEEYQHGRFTGTPDLVYWGDEGLIIRDLKTTSDRPGATMLDYQPYYYMWLVSQATGLPVEGFEYEFLRKKVPTQPRLTRMGTIADYKRVDTTSSIFLQFMYDNDLDGVPEYRERYEELKAANRFSWLQSIEWNDSIVAQVEAEITEWATRMDEDVLWPRYVKAYGLDNCQSCDYFEICSGELAGQPIEIGESYGYSDDETGGGNAPEGRPFWTAKVRQDHPSLFEFGEDLAGLD